MHSVCNYYMDTYTVMLLAVYKMDGWQIYVYIHSYNNTGAEIILLNNLSTTQRTVVLT